MREAVFILIDVGSQFETFGWLQHLNLFGAEGESVPGQLPPEIVSLQRAIWQSVQEREEDDAELQALKARLKEEFGAKLFEAREQRAERAQAVLLQRALAGKG